MQVLLKKDVPRLGQSGDIKNVKPGYARNYLIPNGLVILADTRSKKEKEFLRQVQERKKIKRKREAEKKVEDLKGLTVEIKAKHGSSGKLYGSVTNIDIHKKLTAQGIEVERRMILLSEPIKTLGTFEIPLKVYSGVQTKIKVIVFDENSDASIPQEETPKEKDVLESHTSPKPPQEEALETQNNPTQEPSSGDTPSPPSDEKAEEKEEPSGDTPSLSSDKKAEEKEEPSGDTPSPSSDEKAEEKEEPSGDTPSPSDADKDEHPLHERRQDVR